MIWKLIVLFSARKNTVLIDSSASPIIVNVVGNKNQFSSESIWFHWQTNKRGKRKWQIKSNSVVKVVGKLKKIGKKNYKIGENHLGKWRRRRQFKKKIGRKVLSTFIDTFLCVCVCLKVNLLRSIDHRHLFILFYFIYEKKHWFEWMEEKWNDFGRRNQTELTIEQR